MLKTISLLTFLMLFLARPAEGQPVGTTFLADITPAEGLYRRVLGSAGSGAAGVPVAGGYDMDRDGITDYAMASMQASPQGRTRAGQVFLVFGDGTASGVVDTAEPVPNVLEIHGDGLRESTGSEIWMADLTGDGYGELIICRQNYSPDVNRFGAGAMTLVFANPRLKVMAAEGLVLDLRNPPEDIEMLTLIGAQPYSRLCIWARNGDVTGDGIDDLAIGADQEANDGDRHGGAVYLLRGGDWLPGSDDIDLADFGTVAVGNLARVRPKLTAGTSTTEHYHFGATLQLADLDGDDTAELIAAAALNRAGAGLPPAGPSGNTHASGGTPDGSVFIAWDDNFAGSWIPSPDFAIGGGSGTHTIIDGGTNDEANPGPINTDFGEELLGGLDYDDNGMIDLFVGDLTANGYADVSRPQAGTGHIIYDISSLKGLEFGLDSSPDGFSMATFLGPSAGAISGDTALHGDFNADGIGDIAVCSPMDSPFGVSNAGTAHILLGKSGKWPVFSDLAPSNYPSSADVQVHEIYGRSGRGGAGGGDVLCYSAADGDMTDDGIVDLLVNEMRGDGSDPDLDDVGNMIIIDSLILFRGQQVFESGFEP